MVVQPNIFHSAMEAVGVMPETAVFLACVFWRHNTTSRAGWGLATYGCPSKFQIPIVVPALVVVLRANRCSRNCFVDAALARFTRG